MKNKDIEYWKTKKYEFKKRQLRLFYTSRFESKRTENMSSKEFEEYTLRKSNRFQVCRSICQNNIDSLTKQVVAV